jgi:hypothetical protein
MHEKKKKTLGYLYSPLLACERTNIALLLSALTDLVKKRSMPTRAICPGDHPDMLRPPLLHYTEKTSDPLSWRV